MNDVAAQWGVHNLVTEHLFRHLSELDSGRGGYLEGEVWFSEQLLSRPLNLKIALVADNDRVKGRMHPNLLYITRFVNGKRERDKEPKNPLCLIELIIEDGKNVLWWTDSEAQLAGYYQQIAELVPGPQGGKTLLLKDLFLTVIISLQRTNGRGIRVRDAINLRRQMFEETQGQLEDTEWEKIIKEVERHYTKDSKTELDRIRLEFTLSLPPNGSRSSSPGQTVISDPISNTKSRNVGAFDLEPLMSSQKACCRRQRRIILFSKFKLPQSAKEAFPRFVVKYDGDPEYKEDERLRQPDEVQTIHECAFVFFSPCQDETVIGELLQANARIYIEGFRPRDRHRTETKLEFQYLIHGKEVACELCYTCPDTLDQATSAHQALVGTQQTTRPGLKRRRLTHSTTTSYSNGAASGKSPRFLASPPLSYGGYSSNSPESMVSSNRATPLERPPRTDSEGVLLSEVDEVDSAMFEYEMLTLPSSSQQQQNDLPDLLFFVSSNQPQRPHAATGAYPADTQLAEDFLPNDMRSVSNASISDDMRLYPDLEVPIPSQASEGGSALPGFDELRGIFEHGYKIVTDNASRITGRRASSGLNSLLGGYHPPVLPAPLPPPPTTARSVWPPRAAAPTLDQSAAAGKMPTLVIPVLSYLAIPVAAILLYARTPEFPAMQQLADFLWLFLLLAAFVFCLIRFVPKIGLAESSGFGGADDSPSRHPATRLVAGLLIAMGVFYLIMSPSLTEAAA